MRAGSGSEQRASHHLTPSCYCPATAHPGGPRVPHYDELKKQSHKALRHLARGFAANLPPEQSSACALLHLYHMFALLYAPPRGLACPLLPELFPLTRYPALATGCPDKASRARALAELTHLNGQPLCYCRADIRHLGSLYEELPSHHLESAARRRKRKAHGTFYTPPHIVAAMVRRALTPLLCEATRRAAPSPSAQAEAVLCLALLDPAMGSGAFLLEAVCQIAHFLLDQAGPPPDAAEPSRVAALRAWEQRAAQSCIYGVDLDPLAVDIARLSLWLETAPAEAPASFLSSHLRAGDTLGGIEWQRAFPEIFASPSGGFDLVIGNPPYVRHEELAPRKPALAQRFPEVYHGGADLSTYFICQGVRLARAGGRLCYLTSGTFRKLQSGAPLRRFLAGCCTLHELVEPGPQQLFARATTYPVIMTLERTPPLPGATFTLREHSGVESTCPLPAGAGSWVFPRAVLRHILDGWSGAFPLHEMLGGPLRRGITTGCNAAFVVDQSTRDRLLAADPVSAEILKPLLRGKDLRPWCQKHPRQWLILARRGIDIEAYPAIKALLEPFRERLESCSPGHQATARAHHRPWAGRGSGSHPWYELQSAARYAQMFEQPRIHSAKVSRMPCFSLTHAVRYAANTSYVLPIVDDESGYYLLGVLNSHVCHYFCRCVFSARANGYYEVQPGRLARFPIPDPGTRERTAAATLARQISDLAWARCELRRAVHHHLLAACPTPKPARSLERWWMLDEQGMWVWLAQTRKGELPPGERAAWEEWFARQRAREADYTARIARLEEVLNQRVCELYGLAPTEVRLIEQETGCTRDGAQCDTRDGG